MRRMVLWDTACNFNAFISNQSTFNCLITGESTLVTHAVTVKITKLAKKLRNYNSLNMCVYI